MEYFYTFKTVLLHVFSCDFCKILQNSFSIEQLWTTATNTTTITHFKSRALKPNPMNPNID